MIYYINIYIFNSNILIAYIFDICRNNIIKYEILISIFWNVHEFIYNLDMCNPNFRT